MRASERAFGEGWLIQTQSPIILDDRSEILNLGDRVLEVHREPAGPGPARRSRGCLAIDTFDATATVAPLAAPAAAIRVADLLP